VAIVRLHPYEYVYFNELAGGVRGASRAYEMDYWATSYRETMAYINREALPDATVVVGSAEELFDVYARPDLHLARTPAAKTQDGKPEFAMITTRSNADLGFFSQAPVVFRVEVDGATLALVRRVP
jgi:hypothetical protein